MKKIALLLLAAAAAFSLSAQTRVVGTPDYRAANWQVSVGAGVQMYWSSARNLGDGKSKLLVPQYELSVGKWFNHMWGIRVAGTVGELKSYTNQMPNPYANRLQDTGNYRTKFNYWNVHANVMFDVFQAVTPCATRFYSPIIYVGAGFIRSNRNSGHENSWSANAGLINRFRVSRCLDINLNLNATMVKKDFDKQSGGSMFEGPIGATLGLTYKF